MLLPTDLNEEAILQRLFNKKRKSRADLAGGLQDSGAEDGLGSPLKKVKRPVGRPRKHPAIPQGGHAEVKPLLFGHEDALWS